MGELFQAFLSSLQSKMDNMPGFEDTAKKSYGESPIGRGMDAMGKEDATATSVYNAAKQGMKKTEEEPLPTLQQGVVGMQQPTYTQPNYMGGIPSLLQGYGKSSQGLLPYIGAR
jgi:hypothetical protein